MNSEGSKAPPWRSCWVGKRCSGHCPFGFQGDQRDEEEESQMKKSESEVEVRAGLWQVRQMGKGWLRQRALPSSLTLPLCPQEAAAIIAQRPDNPREFFRQQERVASASGGSCDAPAPFNHRPGSLWPPPCLICTSQTMALNPFGTSSWKRSLAQGLLGEGKTPFNVLPTPAFQVLASPEELGWGALSVSGIG